MKKFKTKTLTIFAFLIVFLLVVITPASATFSILPSEKLMLASSERTINLLFDLKIRSTMIAG